MKPDPVICQHCGSKIFEYFSTNYNGKRGKCKTCNTDFPLE